VQVDVAVNITGKMLKKPIMETEEAEFYDMFAVNTKVRNCTRDARITRVCTSPPVAMTVVVSPNEACQSFQCSV